MSVLFTPMNIGSIEIKNRFVQSATYECMAGENGEVTDELVKRYTRLAKGEVGLIIPGYMYIHKNGQAMKYQTGIDEDNKIEGLKKLVNAVHDEGGKIVFQIAHAGRQTTKEATGQTPIAPSRGSRDNVYLVKPREMTHDDIRAVITAFSAAAMRGFEAGADGVQIHAAHGYLVNQFLSPFFNKRTDDYGGSAENRFRFLREIIFEIRKNISTDKTILVKLNTRDYTPKEGITLDVGKLYAKWLTDLKIDGVEVSCGTLSYSMFNMVRGNVPVNDIVMNFPLWRKILGKMVLKKLEGKFDLQEGYNLDAAKTIKPVIGNIPLLLVGGMRQVKNMEEVINKGWADFISMSRPFIREPNIVKKFKEGKTKSVACVSCNRCFAGAANHMPVYCYNKGFPA
jgi:2,4-dienoyl-CoA reductase-like NADH-dependent reductase (Old Yellow Enzyme family)